MESNAWALMRFCALRKIKIHDGRCEVDPEVA